MSSEDLELNTNNTHLTHNSQLNEAQRYVRRGKLCISRCTVLTLLDETGNCFLLKVKMIQYLSVGLPMTLRVFFRLLCYQVANINIMISTGQVKY